MIRSPIPVVEVVAAIDVLVVGSSIVGLGASSMRPPTFVAAATPATTSAVPISPALTFFISTSCAAARADTTRETPMTKYRKSITAGITGLIGWATAVVASPAAGITASEWIALATVAAVTAGVYQAPNKS